MSIMFNLEKTGLVFLILQQFVLYFLCYNIHRSVGCVHNLVEKNQVFIDQIVKVIRI